MTSVKDPFESWDLSPNIVSLLVEEGFIYDSSMMGHDSPPYEVRVGDASPKDGTFKFGHASNLIETPVSWKLDDFPHFEYLFTHPGSGLRAGPAVLENWINDFEYMYENVDSGLFSIVFHPQIIGRGHRMLMLEKLIRHVLGKRNVWITTLEQVANASS